MPSPDRGLRSVEVDFVNEVQAQLMVVDATLANAQSSWIGGEVAGAGVPILPGMPWQFGVCVEEFAWATASAALAIRLHDQPERDLGLALAFSNGPDGVSTCTFTPGSGLVATVAQANTGDPAHSLFKVTMTGALGLGTKADQSPAA